MRLKRPSSVWVALGLAGLLLAALEFRLARSLAAEAAAAQQRLSALAGSLRGLKQRPVAPAGAAGRTANAAAIEAPDMAAVNSSVFLQRRGFIAKNPNLRALYLQQFRAEIPRKWSRLFQSLNLTPGQIEAFKDQLVDWESKKMDIASTGQGSGSAAFKEGAIDFKAAIGAIIGQDNVPAFRVYNLKLGTQPILNEFAVSLVDTPEPLSHDQIAQFQQVMAQTDPNAANWDVVVEQSRKFLSPVQMDALTAVAGQQSARHQMYILAHPAKFPAKE